MKKIILRIEFSVAIALAICCILNITAFSNKCDDIRDKMLRMHVVANSDSIEDQNLKLKVRDAVLLKGKEIFDGSVTADEAVEKITPHIDSLEKTISIKPRKDWVDSMVVGDVLPLGGASLYLAADHDMEDPELGDELLPGTVISTKDTNAFSIVVLDDKNRITSSNKEDFKASSFSSL